MGLSSLLSYTFVCDLFLPGTKIWNEQLICSIFNHDTSIAILNMHIPPTDEDYLIWKPDRRSSFTVKSAYNTLCASSVNNAIASDNIPRHVWKHLLKYKVPHKVQLFVWICLKNIVPVRAKLACYNPEVEPHCKFCNNSLETINHLLVECDYATSIWNALNVDITTDIQHYNSFQTWVASWFSAGEELHNNNRNEGYVIKLMCTIWYIWKDRCNLIFQDIPPNKNITISRIQYLTHLCNHVVIPTSVNRQCSTLNKDWIPLEEGFLKLNIDASYMSETKKGSIGLMVRDHAVGVKGFKLEEEVEADVGAEHFECKALFMAVDWMKRWL
ncbi:uncharacterized protein LOC113351654 [Papaver somniferum]|uniref:uncharacterized protein LOC113351654 n=1 Tax=Papaver somniferum TaxID=3469 RepID=UPI000E6F8026|nr:uncharacterized protein LOC113351654 [Papaver somniferum]